MFRDPCDVALRGDRFRVLQLEYLIELKLACALSAPHRFRDLDDVVRLVRNNTLPRNYSEKLDPYVRQKFDELWQLAQHAEEDYSSSPPRRVPRVRCVAKGAFERGIAFTFRDLQPVDRAEWSGSLERHPVAASPELEHLKTELAELAEATVERYQPHATEICKRS